MSDQMQAAILYGKEDLRLEQLPIPRAEPGELIVRVGAALTCGTDLKVFRRGYHARMLQPPVQFGHELAGTIAEVGEGVLNFDIGERIVALNSAPCDACFWCERGQQNLCADLLFNNGAYAEYLRVPARIVEKNTLHIPDELPLEHAALTEPLACVMRGLEESAAHPGDTLAVIGAGPIGLLFVHAAALAGMEVIAVVKREEQIDAARAVGAAHVVHTGAVRNPVAAVRALTPDDRGVDIAIEAVAVPETWQWAVEMARRGGMVNFFGGPPAGTRVKLDTNLLHYSELTLKASFHHTPSTVRSAFKLLTGGRFLAQNFITGRAPLSEVGEVYERMIESRTISPDAHRDLDIKTVIIP
jgi:L-iditol 2-dehydrogenase